MDNDSIVQGVKFPFLFGGAFIEARLHSLHRAVGVRFPFLFGGAFIEARRPSQRDIHSREYFPSFSEGLSLRRVTNGSGCS